MCLFGVFFSVRFFRYVIWFTGYKAIPTTNTREVTCHGLTLENEALNFCLREEDMVTKWWAILKNTVTYRKASCFSLLFLLKIHTSVFATVSPWIAIKRSMVRNDNSLQSLSLLKHQEFLFAFTPKKTLQCPEESREGRKMNTGVERSAIGKQRKLFPLKMC